ncbi:MAG: hypothetical protein JW797_15300 [Bradymonadales bacterium]|nr:hypothetical protein [Bradymonadales bacterium]
MPRTDDSRLSTRTGGPAIARQNGTARGWPISVLAAAVLLLVACSGGYAGRIAAFRDNLDRGDPQSALVSIDRLVAEAETTLAEQRDRDSDYPLFLLERGTLYQALGDHASAVRDFNQADQMLEILDLTPKGAENVGRYLWSDSSVLYRAPLYEKLMVNVLALSSYLALGDLAGAQVEARRLAVLNEYFENTELSEHPMLGAAAAMGGLAMELSGQPMAALRYYLDAYRINPTPALAEAVARMSPGTVLSDHAEVVAARHQLGLQAGQEVAPAPERELVAIVYTGLAPRRLAERYPVGMVVGWVDGSKTYQFSHHQRTTLERIEAEDLLTWINFPVLEVRPHLFGEVDLALAEQAQSAQLLVNVESFALAQWEQDRPGIAFAALTRAITRILAREVVQALGSDRTETDVAGLILQAAMQMADTPDTRSWVSLPSQIWMARMAVEPGPQTVMVNARGPGYMQSQALQVEIPEEGATVVVVRFFD